MDIQSINLMPSTIKVSHLFNIPCNGRRLIFQPVPIGKSNILKKKK